MTSHDRQRRAAADAPAARIRRPIQARLEVGPVDDPMEVEAEATADRVVAAIQTAGGAAPTAAARSLAPDDELKGGGPASSGSGGGPAAAADSKKLPAGLAGGAPTNEVGEAKTASGGGPTAAELKNTGGAPAGLDEEEAKQSDDLLQGSRIARAGGPEEEEPLQGYRIARAGGPEEEEPLQGSRIARAGGPEEEEPMQGSRTARSSAVGAEGGAVEADLEARLTAGGGAPLPEPVRATMENAFGADFSAVRVSENPAAAEIGALAYTTGADVRFAPGRFQPGSTEGQHLLAHELTHVVQQGAAPAATAARAVAQREAKKLDVAHLSLHEVLAGYRGIYRAYLNRIYSAEQLDFLDALDAKMDRQQIVDTFVVPGAPKEINISYAERKPVIEAGAAPETLRSPMMNFHSGLLIGFLNDPQAIAALGG